MKDSSSGSTLIMMAVAEREVEDKAPPTRNGLGPSQAVTMLNQLDFKLPSRPFDNESIWGKSQRLIPHKYLSLQLDRYQH